MSDQAIMLTFVTKYSRIPMEDIKIKWYNAMMETGKEIVLIPPKGAELIYNCIYEKSVKLGIEVINMIVLPDHIHINIYTRGEELSSIVNGLKGYSAYMYNRSIQGTEKGKGRQNKLRARGYSYTYLDNEEHLHRAIEYVQNNHLKHVDRRGEEYLKGYVATGAAS